MTDELDLEGDSLDVEVTTWRSVPDALIFDSTVDPGSVRLWAALCSYGESFERCFPGVETLARRLRVSESTIHRGMKALRETGWLDVTPRFDAEGRQRSNGYLVRRTPRSSVTRGGVTDDTLGGVTGDRGEGVTDDTRKRARKNESNRNEKSLDASLSSGGAVVKIDSRKELAVARDKVSRELLNRWWEGEVPRPAQPYVACLKVVSKMIEVGWSPDDVFFALREAPVVSTGALTFALKNRRKRSASSQTETLLAMMTKLDGMSVEDQERWWNTEGPGRLNHG